MQTIAMTKVIAQLDLDLVFQVNVEKTTAAVHRLVVLIMVKATKVAIATPMGVVKANMQTIAMTKVIAQ